LAFLKLFARNKMVWPFLNVDKKEYILSYFNKFFEGNLAIIWPFLVFQDVAFFETAYGQIWPF